MATSKQNNAGWVGHLKEKKHKAIFALIIVSKFQFFDSLLTCYFNLLHMAFDEFETKVFL
jgi:hypothetical protein